MTLDLSKTGNVERGVPVLKSLIRRPEFGALGAAILVYLFFFLMTLGTRFGGLPGTSSWLNTSAELGIIAAFVGMLMIAGELDLSIGSVLGASSFLLAAGTKFYGVEPIIMVAITLVFGISVGLLNGLVVVKTKLPSFIVTLGMNFAVAGLALGLSRLLTNTTSVSMPNNALVDFLFAARWQGFYISVFWWLAILAITTLILSRMRLGNWIYATGGNYTAARGAGVPTEYVKMLLFAGTGFGAALVGVIQTVEFHSGNAANGQGYIFQAPIVAAIGGVLLTGGYGSTLGVALGAAIYGIISVGIFYTGWNTDWAQLFLGVLLLAAVLANGFFRRLALTER